MNRSSKHRDAAASQGTVVAFMVSASLVLSLVAAVASALPTGKIQGKIVATDTGEPIGFADILLIPADTTLHKVGGLTNADGTFLLEAAPGRYTLQCRAISYATKRIEGLAIEAGKLVPFNTALAPEAIQQEEVVVEAKAVLNNESGLLAARKKAAAVGDAVSAEQVRKSPDKDAAEVLRRVTGLSVSDNKYVFVRGLGERYSSTEVDGVRIASPEQNKRVVPLDLVPANLLDNIVVQKTYTADRPGEFGGGDVQVRTKDFPGRRVWSFSIAQGYVENVTFQQQKTYESSRADVLGMGADFRKIPDAVYQTAGDRPLTLSNNPAFGFNKATLAGVGETFKNIWSPTTARALPNAGYSVTYGDEFKPWGRSLGVIGSGTLTRTFDQQHGFQRFYAGGPDTLYDYAVARAVESVQLGAMSGLSYRLSPGHSLHVRALYTRGADDEVRTYEGQDHNRVESTTGTWLVHRNTRLMYVERDVFSGTVEGQHEMPRLLGTSLDWKLNHSAARRRQPDRRETMYDKGYYYDGTGNLVEYWALGSTGSREYGDLEDDGWGGTITGTKPYKLFGGKGKIVLGYDRQKKDRDNFYRRFNFYANGNDDPTKSPEQLFAPGAFDSSASSAYVDEATLNQDNYHATQRVTSGFLSTDVPFGPRVRATLGVRVEKGSQDVTSFDLFDASRITAEGGFENTDWLPSGNLTFAMTEAVNLRLAASRTLSRPDLNELSPSPALEYVGGFLQTGNPNLHRATIDNYDARVEAFPGLSEVLAAGVFYKKLHEPIEQTIVGGAPPVLMPRNSDHGENMGVELEARAGLGRLWGGLSRLAFNSNASIIQSRVFLKPQVSELGTQEHPLQGQAAYLFNAALSYASAGNGATMSVLVNAVGKRLRTLGHHPLPDVYEQPAETLDVTASFGILPGSRLKLNAKNLLDGEVQLLQGDRIVSSYKNGREYSVAFTFGS